MKANHYNYLPCDINWHAGTDDFGNEFNLSGGEKLMTGVWSNAYRFANGQTFEQANMRSIDCLVEEH